MSEDVQVRVLEESADTIYLVLPFTPAVGEGGELSDQDLAAVAGGGSSAVRGMYRMLMGRRVIPLILQPRT